MTYIVKTVPSKVEDLPRFLSSELRVIADLLNESQHYTEEQLANKESSINKRFKSEGLSVWDSTNKRPVWATGKEPEDVWITGSETIAHSPI